MHSGGAIGLWGGIMSLDCSVKKLNTAFEQGLTIFSHCLFHFLLSNSLFVVLRKMATATELILVSVQQLNFGLCQSLLFFFHSF